MLKKFAALILTVFVLVFSLAGCKNSDSKEEQAVSSTTLVNGTKTDATSQSTSTIQEEETNKTDEMVTTQTATATDATATNKATTSATNKATVTSGTNQTTATTTTAPTEEPVKKYPLPTAITSSEYYGFKQLGAMGNSNVLQGAYQEIVSGVQAMKKEIEFLVPLTKEEVMTVFYYYHDDYPQHFWCDSAFEFMLEGESVTSILPQYTMTLAQKDDAQRKFDAAVSACLEEASFGKNDYEREKIIHDYLAKQIVYQKGENAHNAYGALVEKKAVCDGYSRAFQWVLYQVGISSLIAEGTSINPGSGGEQPHAWNVVKIGGEYYHVDLTWDDASSKEVMYAYFNMTTQQIGESHRISSQNAYPLPNCTATDANYHVKNGTVITSFSVDNIATLMQRSSGNLHVYVTDKPENFVNWFKTNVGSLAKKVGVTGSYSYQTLVLGNEIAVHITSK